MRLLRTLQILMVALLIVGCGSGSSSSGATPTSAPTATERPKPTVAPTESAKATAEPTEEEEPTEEPTEEPGGGSDIDISDFEEGTVPPPPDSEEYVKGQDPIVDAAIEGMQGEIDNQEDVALSETKFYTSKADAQAIIDFYDEVMPQLGWDGPTQSDDQEFGKVAAYSNADGDKAALVVVLDLTSLGQEGQIVFTSVGEEGTGGGTAKPTDKPADSAGGDDTSKPFGTSDIPAPPDSESFTEGDDEITDVFVENFLKSFNENFTSGTVTSQEAYISDATPEELKEFYDEEMKALGWEASTEASSAQTLAYTRGDSASLELALITTFAQSDLGGGTGTIVLIVVAKNE